MKSHNDRGHSVNIRLKLLEENNVILMKCSGYETEMFMPAIIDGRLSIINVVPQRRCRCISTNFIVGKETKRFDITQSQTISNWRLSSVINNSIEINCDENVSQVDELDPLPFLSEEASTPEQVRHATFRQRPAISKALNFDDVICRDERLSSPSLESLQLPEENTCSHNQSNVLSEISSRRLEIPNGSLSNIEWPHSSLIENKIPGNDFKQENFSFLSKQLPDLPRWQKVLTPIRTYSRLKYSPSCKSNKSSADISKNSTEGLKAEKLVVKLKQKKYMKVEEKTRISPKSFKRQLEQKNVEELFQEIHQQHKLLEIHKKPAFELFTTPTFQSYMSNKLKIQYQNRCTNKGASTYPKYKKLAAIKSIHNS